MKDELEKFPLKIEEIDIKKAIGCGFKQDWISAESGDVKASMCSGAGCGNHWLTLTVTKNGISKYYRADMAVFFERFLELVAPSFSP